MPRGVAHFYFGAALGYTVRRLTRAGPAQAGGTHGMPSTKRLHKALPGRPFRSLLRYNRPYLRDYVAGGLLASVHALVALAMPLVVQGIVGQFEAGSMTGLLLGLYVGGLVAVSLVAGVARYFQRTLMINASRKFEYDLRNDYFRHVQSLSRGFFNRTPTGDIMARATNDVSYVRDLVGPGIMYSIDMLRVPVSLGLMLYLSTRLTLIALIPLPFLSLVVYALVRFLNRWSRIVQEQFSTLTARVQENLAGARVVKAHGIADTEIRDFRQVSEKYMRDNLWLAAVSSFAWPLVGVLMGAAVLLIVWQGGAMVIRGALSLADMTAFLVCLIMLVLPLAQFGWVLTLYQRGMVAMNRISDILNVEPDIRDGEGAAQPGTPIAGEVVFEDVSFAYDGRPVLRGASFTIPAGTSAAIVGATGCGKSTVVSLLTREYDPDSGNVRVDGQDLRSLPLRVLREAVGCAPQDTFVFSDTIRGNLALARAGATDEEVRRACDIAQFNADVEEMPLGFDTLLGERGINLSGGQKQRLAIARAVLRDPRILVLDDALSSVDTNTEERILSGLRAFMAARTSILISHRVSTVRHADQILVLDDGAVAERGTHDELVARGGIYSGMHRRQLLEEALEAGA
jgi:ATP-binding cassette subfamily B protein